MMSVILMSVVMLSVTILNVIILSVKVPRFWPSVRIHDILDSFQNLWNLKLALIRLPDLLRLSQQYLSYCVYIFWPPVIVLQHALKM